MSFSLFSCLIWSKMNSAIFQCLLAWLWIQMITVSFVSTNNHQYQPLIENKTELYQRQFKQSNNKNDSPSSQTNNWTPLFGSRTSTQSNSLHNTVIPSPDGTLAYVVPTSHHVDGNQTFVASESISRSSYQKPQNTYMIQPAKYQQAFTINFNKTSKTSSSSSKALSKKTSKNNKIINSEKIPIPMIKPHRHGATLGFDLPDQGLTLYLDINELATKPMAQNIGLKVVSHNKSNNSITEEEEVGESNVSKIENIIELNTNNNLTTLTTTKHHSNKLTNRKSAKKTNGTKKSTKKLKLKQKSLSKENKLSTKSKSNIASPIVKGKKSKPSENDRKSKNSHNHHATKSKFITDSINNRTDIPPSASRIPATYATQSSLIEKDESESEKLNMQQKKENDFSDVGNENEESGSNRTTKSTDDEEDENEEENNTNISDNDSIESLLTVGDTNEDSKHEDEEESTITTEIPITSTTTYNLLMPTETEDSNQSSIEVKKQEFIDNELVAQVHTLLQKSAKLIDLSANTCGSRNRCNRNTCATNLDSQISNTSTVIREIAQQLDANLIMTEIAGLFESELQDFMDFSSSGYTIILPSNNAVRRLPPNLMKQWKKSIDSFTLDAYMIEGLHPLESLTTSKSILARNKMRLHINSADNETYTINGQRVIYGNQKAPNRGLVHIIDGLLYPSSEKNIIDTLKSCGRFDGFVTLAEGTGFAETLKKDGPFTVFVPSNDALQKVPDNDLEIIRRNMTALKEFLMYHVAQGVFFSQDLIDGQYLPSILEGQYLQAGIRVDGCSRRLVEVNVSPLYRADITASNGVIHVVDWILKPDDRDWCNGVILPRRR